MTEETRPGSKRFGATKARLTAFGASGAVDTAVRNVPSGSLFFCVIDRLCYENLDLALTHVRIQHGLATRGEMLVRARLLAGTL